MTDFTCWVPGLPVPKGSLKAFVRPGSRFANLKENNADKVRPWMSAVTLAARDAGATPIDGPVSVGLHFFMPRPKSHFNAKGEIKESAPFEPASAPDIDKLIRAVLDALTGVAFGDDAQVVKLEPSPWKSYATPRGPGLVLSVRARARHEALVQA